MSLENKVIQQNIKIREFSKKGIPRRQGKPIIIPKKCEDYAWFLGVMCGDGYSTYSTDNRVYSVVLNVVSKEFRDKFADVTSELFGLGGANRCLVSNS